MTIQEKMQLLLNRLTTDGGQRGLQLAAYVNGKLLVNAWAGTLDAGSGRRVSADTLFPVFSTGKAMLATVIHRLAQRGRISYDQPIAQVWPEFAAHGKGAITIGEALYHTAGIPNMPTGIGFAELHNWDTMCRAVAALPLLWPPGTRIEYHAITSGWILGEVACRVTGKPFGQLIQEEICQPLKINGMYMGIPAAVEGRVVTLEEPGWQPPAVENLAIPNWMCPLSSWMNQPEARRACVPASNAIMTAHAIARHYAGLLPGGVDGVELLPASRVAMATQMQRPPLSIGDDQPKDWGLGYRLGGGDSIYGSTSAAFGFSGYGGSVGFADPTIGLAFGLTKNFFGEKENVADLVARELRAALQAAGVSPG